MSPASSPTVFALPDAASDTYPIGIFDSGVGGLTVAAAIRRDMPAETLLYLADIARQPYGTKSARTVIRYAVQAAEFLVGRGIKALVVACNTASAVALDAIQARFPGLTVIGVVEAGAAGAVAASASGRIVVAATEGTCRSGAYERAILRRRPDAHVTAIACPLFVGLAEEGLTDGDIVESVARHYLSSRFVADEGNDCLVLGCTHFPLLTGGIGRVTGPGVRLVDCAGMTSALLAEALADRRAPSGGGGGLSLLVTADPERFTRIAARLFPDQESTAGVELVDV
ncbi:glutamate racemase [Magnetospirillum sp. SS-4]|uniref:glutamate racemase n=1 Tax=Magnetospirillum sp. SS-4 TaxID=2681465 RepID=UPI001382AA69|nr:glutamate racemase [Magnetospirillum sp. SS-4]CAA7627486.1 Glutamate racemase [Magnetospirillum sp. SS-4]